MSSASLDGILRDANFLGPNIARTTNWENKHSPNISRPRMATILYNGQDNGTIFHSVRETKNAHQLKMYSTHTGLPEIAMHAINQIRFETATFSLSQT